MGNNIMNTKHCSYEHHVGGRDVSITSFNKRSLSPDGFNPWCRHCCKLDSRSRREKQATLDGRVLKTNSPRGAPRPKHPRYVPTTVYLKVKQQLRAIRSRCNSLNIPFSITVDDLLPLPDVCPDLDLPLNYFSGREYSPNRATVDKIIPELGYVPGNVRIVSNQANAMKQDATLNQLKQIAYRWLDLVSRMSE